MWTFGKEKFPQTRHHVMRVDLVEQKFRWTVHCMMRVDLIIEKILTDHASRKEGGLFGNQIFWWFWHPAMTVDLLGTNALVILAPCNEGWPFQHKNGGRVM